MELVLRETRTLKGREEVLIGFWARVDAEAAALGLPAPSVAAITHVAFSVSHLHRTLLLCTGAKNGKAWWEMPPLGTKVELCLPMTVERSDTLTCFVEASALTSCAVALHVDAR